MEKLNIGIINYIISNKLKDSYFNKNLDESKNNITEFFEIVKDSPILQLEFKIFNNIENKHIDDDLAASRYIDNNINLFEIYTIEEIEKEHEKLKSFLNENINYDDENKITLYESIFTLIEQSLIDNNDVDVNKIDESYSFVLNHIKTPKDNIIKNSKNDLINENIVEIAINKYNEKYGSLNEEDKRLLQKLIKFNNIEKEDLLESLKDENLKLLEGANNENVEDNIKKAIQKIKEMKYDKVNVDNDILSLYELKKEIL